MRSRSTAKVPAERTLEYQRISECLAEMAICSRGRSSMRPVSCGYLQLLRSVKQLAWVWGMLTYKSAVSQHNRKCCLGAQVLVPSSLHMWDWRMQTSVASSGCHHNRFEVKWAIHTQDGKIAVHPSLGMFSASNQLVVAHVQQRHPIHSFNVAHVVLLM